MTEQEVIIARRAFYLGRRVAADVLHIARNEVLEPFIKNYDPNRPCRYDAECVRTGRCPFETACNN